MRILGTYADLGDVQESAYPSTLDTQGDIGWVETIPGWTPVPKVNGYSDGVVNVPAKWAGTNQSPINATVCRYGQASGGPHCGTVETLGLDKYFVIGLVTNVTEVEGSCATDGDSGGTWLSAAGGNQIQGTTIGRSTGNTCDASPAPSNPYTYFQPISNHVSAYEGSAGGLLTAHGAAAATVSGWQCGASSNGPGWFTCSFDYYNSQSDTSYAWYLNNVAQSETGTQLTDICTIGYLVRVKLVLTNLYGSTTKQALFTCEGP